MPSSQESNSEGSSVLGILEKFRYNPNKDRPSSTEVESLPSSANVSSDLLADDDSQDSQNFTIKLWKSRQKSSRNGKVKGNIPRGSISPERKHNGVTFIPETPESVINHSPGDEKNGCRTRSESVSDPEESVVASRKHKVKRVLLSDSESDSDDRHLAKKVKFGACKSSESQNTAGNSAVPGTLAYDLVAYDLFSDKEKSLRAVMQAFPKMDLMKLQDTLVKCGWYAKKAIHVLQDDCNPLTCTHVTKPQLPRIREPDPPAQTQLKLHLPFQIQAEMETLLTERTKSRVSESQRTSATEVAPESQAASVTDVNTESQASSVTEVGSAQSSQSTCMLQLSQTDSTDLPARPVDDAESDSDGDRREIIESSESPEIRNNVYRRKATRQRIHQLSDSDSDENDASVRIISMASLEEAQPKTVTFKVVRNNEHDLSSNEEEEEKAKSKSPSPQPVNERKKKVKHRKKDLEPASDDGEDFAQDELYDSDNSDIDDELNPIREAVLNFFRNATGAELLMVPGCSKKKVEAVVAMRPFHGWADLVRKLQSSRSLSTDMLGAARDAIVTREVMTKLMQKCEKIASDMEKVVAQMNSKSSKGICIKKQPSILNANMKLSAYQMLGLNWLCVMHCRKLNGILADEMGLGKTIQAISFLAHLRMTEKKRQKHLIIVPSSTLDNWLREIQTWCPSLVVIVYHGNQETRRELRLQLIKDILDYDIMVTTYNMISSSSEDRTLFRRLEFHYVVFDEAHMLKNMNSQRYQNLMKIKAERRLLLTGTPLQNNLVELMSLLIFVMPDMFYGKIEQVKQMFASACKSEENRSDYEKSRIDHAKRIMKPFVLRRLKRDVLKELPTKHEEVQHCYFTPFQKQLYLNLVETFTKRVSEEDRGKGSLRSNGVGMMMELRKAANHPLLLRRRFTDSKLREMSKKLLSEPTYTDASAALIYEDMEVMSDFELHKLCKAFKSISSYKLENDDILDSGKFETLDNLLPKLKEKGSRFLLFSQFTMMLDVVEEYMAIRNYTYLRLDGSTPVNERQELMDRFNGGPEIFAFLLSTKAGGLGINLTAANVVLLHDIDFNPYNDKQAEDRCHRLGQTKEVTVKKLIMKESIEEAILKCAMDKLKLERDITTDNGQEAEEDLKTVGNLLKTALGL